MKTKNILKLTALSATIMIAGMAQTKAATTNTVQDITVAFAIYSQGTPIIENKATNNTVDIAKIDTKDFISFLSTNFFTHPKLVLVVKDNGTTNSSTAFEIRDGTNTPVTVTDLAIGNNFKVKDTLDRTNGIVDGKTYSILTLNATNPATAETLSLSGFATTKHASIKFGNEILTVDTLTTDVSGSYASNAVSEAVSGSISIGGYTRTPIQ